MIKFNFILVLILCMVVLSCHKKDKETDPGPGYSFKNQKLSGKIGGTKWDYIYGNAVVSGTTQKKIAFHFYNVITIDSCDQTWTTNQAFLTVDSLVGVQKLSNSKT